MIQCLSLVRLHEPYLFIGYEDMWQKEALKPVSQPLDSFEGLIALNPD